MNDGVQGIFATYTGNYGEKGLERYALKILADELANCIINSWGVLPMHYKTSVTSDGKQEHRVLINIVTDEFLDEYNTMKRFYQVDFAKFHKEDKQK